MKIFDGITLRQLFPYLVLIGFVIGIIAAVISGK